MTQEREQEKQVQEEKENKDVKVENKQLKQKLWEAYFTRMNGIKHPGK